MLYGHTVRVRGGAGAGHGVESREQQRVESLKEGWERVRLESARPVSEQKPFVLPFFSAFCSLSIQHLVPGTYYITGTLQGSGKAEGRRKDTGGLLQVFAASRGRAGAGPGQRAKSGGPL